MAAQLPPPSIPKQGSGLLLFGRLTPSGHTSRQNSLKAYMCPWEDPGVTHEHLLLQTQKALIGPEMVKGLGLKAWEFGM